MMCQEGHDDIIVRLNEVEDCLGEVKELAEDSKETLDSIHKCVAGSIGNGEERPGLVERVRAIEKWIKTRIWLERLIVSVVVAQIIALLFIATNLNSLFNAN